MPQYHCYFVQKHGVLTAWRTFESDSDDAAQDYALGLSVCYPDVDKVEVWEATRLTLNYRRPAAQTPDELRMQCSLAIGAARKESDPSVKQIIALCADMLAQEAEALERRAS